LPPRLELSGDVNHQSQVTIDGNCAFTFLDAMALPFVVTATSGASDSLIDRLADGKLRPASVAGLQVAYLPIVFPSSHASNLLDLKNGDLLCAYYSGRWERKSDAVTGTHENWLPLRLLDRKYPELALAFNAVRCEVCVINGKNCGKGLSQRAAAV
jgi:hypothetical protein